jgi:hypothetical protein
MPTKRALSCCSLPATLVTVRKAPAERRQPRVVTTHCGCCCCCCCCLHSVGGLIGAAAGSTPARFESDERYVRYIEDESNPGNYKQVSLRQRPVGTPATGLYWLVLALMCLVVSLFGLPWDRTTHDEGLFLVIFALPVIQLAASAVTLIGVLFMSAANRKACLIQLGRITLWSFVGAVIGTGIMYLLCSYVPLMR